jgi:hypothetical protein
LTRKKEVKRAKGEGELTSLERTTIEKIKTLKKDLAQVTAERDVLIGALMAAGLPRTHVDLLLESVHHADT